MDEIFTARISGFLCTKRDVAESVAYASFARGTRKPNGPELAISVHLSTFLGVIVPRMTLDFRFVSAITTQADFTCSITPNTISITDTTLGSRSVTNDIEAVLRRIEHWYQGSVAAFQIIYHD